MPSKKPSPPPAETRIVAGVEFRLIGENWVGVVPLEKLVPFHKNPRKNVDAVPGVRKSIKKYGHLQPLVVVPGGHPGAATAKESEFEIVVGHTRHLGCIELGYDPVPCILADHLTAEQVEGYRIEDNKTAERAEWDADLLKDRMEWLQEQDYDIRDMGFSDKDLQQLFDGWGAGGGASTEQKPEESALVKVEVATESAAAARELIETALEENGIDFHMTW